ncbi:hypothetical protein THIOKS1850006 [Thiocapsa sp. KS1]|nr:hypothetical protein THIOKS1850006 [Thiocapsa sp. KS1]
MATRLNSQSGSTRLSDHLRGLHSNSLALDVVPELTYRLDPGHELLLGHVVVGDMGDPKTLLLKLARNARRLNLISGVNKDGDVDREMSHQRQGNVGAGQGGVFRGPGALREVVIQQHSAPDMPGVAADNAEGRAGGLRPAQQHVRRQPRSEFLLATGVVLDEQKPKGHWRWSSWHGVRIRKAEVNAMAQGMRGSQSRGGADGRSSGPPSPADLGSNARRLLQRIFPIMKLRLRDRECEHQCDSAFLARFLPRRVDGIVEPRKAAAMRFSVLLDVVLRGSKQRRLLKHVEPTVFSVHRLAQLLVGHGLSSRYC